jgi:hemerythrin
MSLLAELLLASEEELSYMELYLYGPTRRHIPEHDTLYNHRCENLKSYDINDYYILT